MRPAGSCSSTRQAKNFLAAVPGRIPPLYCLIFSCRPTVQPPGLLSGIWAGREKPSRLSTGVACPDGSVRWLEWRALCCGRQKIYAVARDITERRRISEAMEEASRKLHLFDDISRHDIKNRLTVLSGYVNLFSRCPAEPYFSMYSAKISETVAAIAEQVEFFPRLPVTWHCKPGVVPGRPALYRCMRPVRHYPGHRGK